jgi:Glycosyl hydrolase family 76
MIGEPRRDRGPRDQPFAGARPRSRVALAACAVALALGFLIAGPVEAHGGGRPGGVSKYLPISQEGVALAAANWGNSRFHWYNEVLHDRARSPQATIWAVVPLWESVDETALANPSAASVNLVKHFAAKAEGYWDPNIYPAPGAKRKSPGYAPYPGNHGNQKTFFDDNAWFGLAFMDAYAVMEKAGYSTLAKRYLHDAALAFNFIRANGWDHKGGGLWWNTQHVIPGGHGRSGEALGAATNLAARLYQATHQSVYFQTAVKYIGWANHHLLKWDGSYANRIPREVTMPHDGEGAMIGAFTALCETNARVPHTVYAKIRRNKTHGRNPSFRLPDNRGSWCSWAESLARHTAFGVKPGGKPQDKFFPLSEGPQWDAIYVRGLLALYGYDHSRTWARLAEGTALRILKNARGAGGLFLKAWNGSSRVPGAPPGELRTHAASVSVFAALAAAGV